MSAEDLDTIKLAYKQFHDRYLHASDAQFMYYKAVMIFLLTTLTLSLLTVAMKAKLVPDVVLFNIELVVVLLFFPATLAAIWIKYCFDVIKYRQKLVEAKGELHKAGLTICYNINENHPDNITFKTDGELGANYRPLSYSPLNFVEYDKVYHLKNDLFDLIRTRL